MGEVSKEAKLKGRGRDIVFLLLVIFVYKYSHLDIIICGSYTVSPSFLFSLFPPI